MKTSLHLLLLSIAITHSSPMILHHGPVVLNFDVQKCNQTDGCEALDSSKNINPTQSTVAEIGPNAKSNKTGNIKLNTTQWNVSDNEIDIIETNAMNMRENQSETRSNLGIGTTGYEYATEYSIKNVNNLIKERRMMDWYMKFNGDKNRFVGDKKESVKSNSTTWRLEGNVGNVDDAENRKSISNRENSTNFYSKIYSNIIDSNKYVINKLNTTKSHLEKSNIKAGVNNNGMNKLEVLFNRFKSSTNSKNDTSSTQSKAAVSKYVLDTSENKTIVLLTKKYNDESNMHNISSQLNKINGTNMKVTYIKTTNQTINQKFIKFDDSNSKLAGNVNNNQTSNSININGNENNDTKSNYSMKQLFKSKVEFNNKITLNQTQEFSKKTYGIRDSFSKENGFINISNDKHDNDFEYQTVALEYNTDIYESTTEFDADNYYKNLYNKTDEIKKTAIHSFIELDKMRSKRTQELEALLSHMVSLP